MIRNGNKYHQIVTALITVTKEFEAEVDEIFGGAFYPSCRIKHDPTWWLQREAK